MLLKVIVINLLLLGLYCTLIVAEASPADRGFSIAILGGICIALHVGLNIIVGLIMLIIGRKVLATSLLISGGLMVIVGFCTWLMLLSKYG